MSDPLRKVGSMSSYVGPAQLVLPDHTCEVEVNLHEFVDLTDALQSHWRGVVMNASFEPAESASESWRSRACSTRGPTAAGLCTRTPARWSNRLSIRCINEPRCQVLE